MRLPTVSTPTRWYAGLAVALLGVAVAIAASAPARDEPALRPLSKPDPVVLARIQAFEAGAERDASGITSFQGPEGRPVYLVIALCCDQFNPLYDDQGRFICAPTGGFTGAGDGKCPAWVHESQSRWRPKPPGSGKSNPSPHAEPAEPPKSAP